MSYFIAFVLSPAILVFNLTQVTVPKAWVLNIAGEYWIAYTVGAYYLTMVLIFWIAYLARGRLS